MRGAGGVAQDQVDPAGVVVVSLLLAIMLVEDVHIGGSSAAAYLSKTSEQLVQ